MRGTIAELTTTRNVQRIDTIQLSIIIGCMEPAVLVRETVLVPRKTPRPPGPDDWASERIRYEREKRGWSTAELARRVTLAGVPLRQPQVWQVESGTPRRRLSVGEAAAFAKVLGLSLAELMIPPEQVASLDLIELSRTFLEWRRDAGILAARFADIAKRVEELSDQEIRTAALIETYAGLTGLGIAEAVAAEVDNLADDYRAVAASIRTHESPWSVIGAATDLVTPAEAGDQDASDGSR